MSYDNTNRGALFDNERKQNDKHPDMTGKINVDGKEWEISGWWKETKAGTILSLSVKPPWKPDSQRQAAPPMRTTEPRQAQANSYQPEPPMAELDSDSIPF